MLYGKNGLSTTPTTAEEARGRNPDQRLHDKLLAIRNGKQGYWSKDSYWTVCPLIYLVSEIILCLALTARKGSLNFASRQMFEKMSRQEILCWLFEEARYALRLNKDQYGNNPEGKALKEEFGYTRDHTNLKEILRLTREEILEKYGAEDRRSRHRPHNKVYIEDVKYGQFLREHGLGHRHGGNITREDLLPVDPSALSGNDPFEKREALLGMSAST